MGPEYKSGTKEGNLVTLREILSVIKYRNDLKEKYLAKHYEELRKEIPYLTNINLEVGESLFLYLNQPPRYKEDTYTGILLLLKDNKFVPFDDWKITDEEKNAILKHQDIFADIYQYSRENNYDKPITLTTISNLFKFSISDNEMFLRLSTDAIKGNFYVVYDPTKTKEKKIISTSEGPLIVDSNVLGVESLFFKPKKDIVKNHYLDEKNPALRFLNHISVFESDLPDYINIERENVLKLSKK